MAERSVDFAGYRVVTEENELVGIITGRDVRFVTDLNQPVSVYMTPKERLVTVREGETRDVVLAKMFMLLHAANFFRLTLDRHVFVDKANAAFLCQGDSQTRFSHGRD